MSDAAQTSYYLAPDPAVLVLRGDDAGEFLNGQVSNDVASLADGESRYALLLTPKGKLRADMTIVRDGDETMVVCAQEHLAAIRHTIETFRIGYFFSSEDATGEWSLVRLIGEQSAAEAVVEELQLPVVCLTSPLGVDLLVERSERDALIAALDGAAIAQADDAALARALIDARVATFGAELGEDTFPAEAALESRAVSFEKGCYVGQETVARMHYKGKPNRHLRTLKAESELTPGAAVVASDGRELGRVGTVAQDGDGSWLALAILRREADTGDTVEAGGVTSTIVEVSTPAEA